MRVKTTQKRHLTLWQLKTNFSEDVGKKELWKFPITMEITMEFFTELNTYDTMHISSGSIPIGL